MKKMAICLFALALAACVSSAAMAGGDPFSTVRTNSGEEAKWEFEGHVLTPSPSHRTANWLYAPSESDDPAHRAEIAACTGGVVDYFDARYATPDLAFLCENYDVVYTWANYAFADRELFGDILADFVDCGGCVVLGQWCAPTAGNYLGGDIMNDPAYRVVASGTYSASSTCWIGDCASECIWGGVSTLCATYHDILTPDPVNGHPCGTYCDGAITYFGHNSAYAGRIHYVSGAGGQPVGGSGPDWGTFLCNLCNCPGATATEGTTWGNVKTLYR